MVFALLAVNALFRCVVAVSLPLYYKEAYCWEWSQHLLWGNPEHPPLAGWLISATTALTGNSVFAIRLGAVVLGTLSHWLVYRLAFALFKDRRIALWSLVISLGIPVLNAVGVLVLPDAPVLFFHLLFLDRLLVAIKRRRWTDWSLSGVALGLALLSKLTAFLTLGAAGLFLLCEPQHRQRLREPGPYLALCLALVLFSPFLFWNAGHGWASFRYQFLDRHHYEFRLDVLKMAEVSFEQVVAASPFLVVLLLRGLCIRRSDFPSAWLPGLRLLQYQSLTVLVCFFLVGSVTQTHPHWTLLAYPTAAICLAAYYHRAPHRWFTRKLRLCTGLSAAGLAVTATLTPLLVWGLPRLDAAAMVSGRKFERAQELLLGWSEFSREVDGRLRDNFHGGQQTVFTNQRTVASMLSFHRYPETAVDLGAFANQRHPSEDAQRYYLNPDELVGRNGLFITDFDSSTEDLRLFERVEQLTPIHVEVSGCTVKRFRCYRVDSLLRSPAEPERLNVSSGKTYRVLPEVYSGFLDSICRVDDAMVCRGWAADILSGEAPESLIVSHGQGARTFPVKSCNRLDVAEARADPRLRNSGFLVELPAEWFRDGTEVRFFVAGKDGIASELLYPSDYLWRRFFD